MNMKKEFAIPLGFFLIVLVLSFSLHHQASKNVGLRNPTSTDLHGTLECQSVTEALRKAHQVIAVVTEDWVTPVAEVQLFHREKRKWVMDDKFSDSRVGKNGMGWGIGLHQLKESQDPKFRADTYRWDFGGKSPAGIFSIGDSFGTNDEISKIEAKKGNMYYPITENLHCLDDYSVEPLFNHLVTDDTGPRLGNLPQVAKSSITSSEHMIEMAHPDPKKYPESKRFVGWEPYQMGFFINHNKGPRETQADHDFTLGEWRTILYPQLGKDMSDPAIQEKLESTEPTPYGACIFFHVKNPDGTGTAGCTAVSVDQLKKVFAWKKRSRDVILIQLPRAQWNDIEKACPGVPTL
jgi:hypothetical protein